MGKHVIVGAGPVGRDTARRLVEAGHTVKLVSRSGGDPGTGGIEVVAADATDAAAMRRITAGADVLYNCANPAYHRWETDWPPIADSLLAAAEAAGAGLVIMGNLYGYGPVHGPMTERTPLAATSRKGRVRARMWHDALAAHRAGRVRVTEARASDYFGPMQHHGLLADTFMPRLFAGRRFRHIAALDVPHTWSYLPDVSAAVATLGTDDRAWGRPWHVPSPEPRTVRQMVSGMARAAGVATPEMSQVPRWALRLVGRFVPVAGEFEEIRYQHDQPFVMDSGDFTDTFGRGPTPLDDALHETVTWWRSRLAVTGGRAVPVLP